MPKLLFVARLSFPEFLHFGTTPGRLVGIGMKSLSSYTFQSPSDFICDSSSTDAGSGVEVSVLLQI
jgi:hypothetical protein